MDDLYGPGMGTAFGLAWAASGEQDRRHGEELERLRAEMLKKANSAFYQEAFKCAAADVLQEIVRELKQDEAGTLAQRRMSDPKNPEARNEAYAQAAAKHVKRLSAGQVRMSRVSMDRLKGKFR
jgi:hypothetical protein